MPLIAGWNLMSEPWGIRMSNGYQINIFHTNLLQLCRYCADLNWWHEHKMAALVSEISCLLWCTEKQNWENSISIDVHESDGHSAHKSLLTLVFIPHVSVYQSDPSGIITDQLSTFLLPHFALVTHLSEFELEVTSSVLLRRKHYFFTGNWRT